MGYEISRKDIKKAKKEHQCNACLFLHEHVSECRHDLQMSISEIRAYLEAKKNDFKIKVGQSYVAQMIEQDGDIYFVKSIPEIHRICSELGLYDN